MATVAASAEHLADLKAEEAKEDGAAVVGETAENVEDANMDEHEKDKELRAIRQSILRSGLG
jgi:hypothetical protein